MWNGRAYSLRSQDLCRRQRVRGTAMFVDLTPQVVRNGGPAVGNWARMKSR